MDNRVRLQASDVAEPVLERLLDAFAHENPKFKALSRARQPTGSELPVIRTWRRIEGEVSFPRGGYRRVRDVLEAEKVPVEVEDRRVSSYDPSIPDHRAPPRFVVGDPLWDHQERAATAAMKRQNCLVRSSTGSGKTTIGFAMIGRLKQRTLVVVSTRNLLDQWVERAELELGIPKREVGIVGAGSQRLRPVSIALQQTLARGIDPEMLEYFGMVLYDEVQEAAARTVFDAIDPWPAKYRIGVSADERRKDRKEFLIHDLFGAVAAEVAQEDLIDRGVVVDVQICVVPTSFQAPWYKSVQVRGNVWMRQSAARRLAEEISTDEARNALARSFAAREVAEGRQVFVFTERVEHALVLDRDLVAGGTRSGTLVGGEEYRRAFNETKARLRSGEPGAGVGTIKAIGKGTDIPTVSSAVVATPIAGNRQLFGQVRGRVCRSAGGKESGRLYYLWDRAVAGKKAIENLERWYRGCVVVFDGSDWVPAREYLTAMRRKAR